MIIFFVNSINGLLRLLKLDCDINHNHILMIVIYY